jgi:transcriptional regulator with XRE-family HTH domain
MAMEPPKSPKDHSAFFKDFGTRLASLRKERRITQRELAEVLGCSQQQVLSFEKGRRRIPLSMLPTLVSALGISFEELFGMQGKSRRRRGPVTKLEKQAMELSKLPRQMQTFVSQMLANLLRRHAVEKASKAQTTQESE